MIDQIRRLFNGTGLGSVLMRSFAGGAGLRVAGMLFGFLAGIQLARYLGAEGYGQYGIAMSIVSLVAVPAEIGLPQLLTKEIASAHAKSNWRKIRQLSHWATKVNAIFSIAILVGVYFWIEVFGATNGQPNYDLLYAGLPIILATGQMNIRCATLRGIQNQLLGELPDAVIRPASFALLLFLYHAVTYKLTATSAILIGLVSCVISLAVAEWLLSNKSPKLQAFRLHGKRGCHLITQSLPMALTQGLHIIQGNALLLVLGITATADVAGIFRAALSMALLIGVPISLINIMAGPIISRLFAQKRDEALRYLVAGLSALTVLSTLLLTLPIFMFGESIVEAFFGSQFIASATPLKIFSLGLIATSTLGPALAILNMTGFQTRVSRAFIISVLVMVATAFPLSMYFGVNGAAISNVISLFICNYLLYSDVRKVLHFNPSIFSVLMNPRILTESHRF